MSTESQHNMRVASQTDQSQFIVYWSEYIKTHSAIEAHTFFKATNKDQSLSDKHFAAHLFGGVLYDTVGMSGLSVCDYEYSFGCFHEFIGRALQSQGLSVLAEIDTYCKTSFDCQHGIGHGLLAYYGYDQSSLEAALRTCSELGSVDPQDGCYGGIYMEYNTRTMLNAEGVSVRELLENESINSICQGAPEYATEACYFWLPQWLIARTDAELSVSVHGASKTCQLITDEKNKRICYIGLGYELISYVQDIQTLHTFCEDTEITAQDLLFEAHCKTAVAASLYANPQSRERAPLMCENLHDEAYAYCSRYATWSDGKRVVPLTVDGL